MQEEDVSGRGISTAQMTDCSLEVGVLGGDSEKAVLTADGRSSSCVVC